MADIDVTRKDNIIVGLLVEIVAEEDSATQEITRGYIKTILSKSDNKKGIKVELTNGAVGHIKYIPSKYEIQKENFKYYNIFFFKDKIYSIWDKIEKRYLVMNRVNTNNGKMETVALLFSDKETAQNIIKGTSLDRPDLLIREVNRKKPIVENFKIVKVDYFSIDGVRKLSFEKMVQWEDYFKSMR